MILLMVNQHWFRKWFGAIMQQTINWMNVDQVLWCHGITSLQWVDLVWGFFFLLICTNLMLSFLQRVVGRCGSLQMTFPLLALQHKWPWQYMGNRATQDPSHWVTLKMRLSNQARRMNSRWVEYNTSVAYRYRKSISIIELFVSIYIDIYRVLSN